MAARRTCLADPEPAAPAPERCPRLRRLRDESAGVSLVEMLVSVTVLMIVLGATLSVLAVSERTSRRDRARVEAIGDVRVGVDRMLRDLRHADLVNSLTATSMDVQLLSAGASLRVLYDCAEPHPTDVALRRCVRWTIPPAGPTPKRVIVDRVLPGPVFAPTNDPVSGAVRSVQTSVAVPARGELAAGANHRIVFQSGFALRNVAGSGA